MSWFADLKTGVKLAVAFGICIALTVFLGAFSVVKLAAVNETSTEIEVNWLPSVRLLGELNTAASDLRVAQMQHVAANNATRMDQAEESSEEIRRKFQETEEKYAKLITSKEEENGYQAFKKTWSEWLAIRSTVLNLSRQNKKSEALEILRSQGAPKFEKSSLELDQLIELNSRGASAASRRGDVLYSDSRKLIALTTFVCAGLAGAMAWFITRMIVAPLGVIVARLHRLQSVCISSLSEAMLALSQGNLTVTLEATTTPIDLQRKDEIGNLVDAFNSVLSQTQAIIVRYEEARSSLTTLIKSVAGNSQTVASASEELTAVSQELGAGAEETSTQASVVSSASLQVSNNVQTVAAGAEELNASIREIARGSSEVSSVASQAVESVEQTSATIIRLGQSSKEIGAIIKTVTAIAEQTNLLALNATIEAARAGAAGKGFAVVANEVKELAKETSRATEDISQKIGGIQSDTEDAVKAIGEVQTIIERIHDLQNSIASAIEEQSATTSEIGRTIEEAARGTSEIAANTSGVAQGAQATASSATQTQSAAVELSGMASELEMLVRQFQYEDTSSGQEKKGERFRESPPTKRKLAA